MAVENLVWGDGSEARDGRFLNAGQLYGAPSLQGRLESFFPIDICALSLFDHNCLVPTYEVVAQTTATKSVPRSRRPQSPIISMPLYKVRYIGRQGMARALRSWLSYPSGFALFIGGPSARNNVHETAPFIIPDSPQVFMQDNTNDCMLAALVNWINTSKRGESARTALHKLRQVHIFPHSLKRCTRVVQGLEMKIGLRTSQLRDITALGTARKALHLVRWNRGNEVDHVVIVDGNRGWILDSAEKHPLRLTKVSLLLCGGVGTRRPCVAEVREILRVGWE